MPGSHILLIPLKSVPVLCMFGYWKDFAGTLFNVQYVNFSLLSEQLEQFSDTNGSYLTILFTYYSLTQEAPEGNLH